MFNTLYYKKFFIFIPMKKEKGALIRKSYKSSVFCKNCAKLLKGLGARRVQVIPLQISELSDILSAAHYCVYMYITAYLTIVL